MIRPDNELGPRTSPPRSPGLVPGPRENFISVFKSFAAEEIRKTTVPNGELNTGMPWFQYASMTEGDLGAIYGYLRTVEPIETIAADTTLNTAQQ